MAIRRKSNPPPAGAPEWMVTYGDMVTLLLTFFVLLLAMSKVKEPEAFIEFMQAVREAFGYVGGVRQLPIDEVQVPRNVNFTTMLVVPIDPHDFSKSSQKGVRGREDTVTSIRRGHEYEVVGGKLYFAPLSAAVGDIDREELAHFAEKLRGYDTMVKVRGHCSRRPVDGTEYADHYELSFARARTVALALIGHGIEPGRLIIEAAAVNEPFRSGVYTDAELRENDVVELMQIDMRVDSFTPPPATSSPATSAP